MSKSIISEIHARMLPNPCAASLKLEPLLCQPTAGLVAMGLTTSFARVLRMRMSHWSSIPRMCGQHSMILDFKLWHISVISCS
jgi:hypothetical protein